MKEDDFLQLYSLLSSKHFPLKKEWLKTCIEYLDQSLGKKSTFPTEMFNLVVQQFLNSKLSETLNPVMKIPTNAAKVIIVKRMIFEVTSYLNVSSSLYEQLSECTRHNDDLSWFHGGSKIDHDEDNRDKEKDTIFQSADKNNNSRIVFKKRGVLKLNLTDGVNTLKAVDLEEALDEKTILPGSKLLLINKVTCRRGILLLNKSNCLHLGGQIESQQYDKIKQLSAALNIDLDAEKKRRQESLEKAAASVSRNHKKQSEKKKNTSLNQSSLSPFLVRTDRKTGAVTNPPRAPPSIQLEPTEPSTSDRSEDPMRSEHWEFSIEEIPVKQDPIPETSRRVHSFEEKITRDTSHETVLSLPPPPPTKRLSSLVIKEKPEKPLTIQTAAETKQNNEKTNSTVEEWTFNSFDNTFKTKHPEISYEKPKKKQLPVQLCRDSSKQKEDIPTVPPRPILGNPNMYGEKRKEITEWIYDERKGSEEEEGNAATLKKEDSVMEIPQCLWKGKFERAGEEKQFELHKPKRSEFNRNLHGPRKRVENDGSKQKSPEIRITSHFPSVKGPITRSVEKTGKIGVEIPSSNLHSINEPIECQEEEEEEMDFQEADEIIPATPYPPPMEHHPEYYDEGINDEDDSILECTIEQEGRLECERWGIGNRKRRMETGDEEHEYNEYNSMKMKAPETDYDIIMKNTSRLSHTSSKIQSLNDNDYRESMRTDQYATSSYTQSSQKSSQIKQNWNFSEKQKTITPPLKVKTERIEQSEDRRMMPMMKTTKNLIQDSSVMKNKQSANVQIYKTPFAKRLNSSDSTSDTTSQLFKRMSDLQIVPLADALVNRKFWMMSKIVVVMPTICTQLHELKSDGIDWLLQISVTDTSAQNVKCRVATDLLNRIFGFTVQQCKNLFNLNQVEELRSKKIEAEKKLVGFKRLDLLVWIEVSPDSEKLPLIVDVKTISDALNIL